MKEINIAKVLIKKRREKGITQDELAGYMGVSKASVSKWETGQSYPDVTFLPVLASYFNISVDELLDYQPQMAPEDIRKLYRRLSADFASKPFDEVLEECRGIVKKYYSCFPLLLEMGILLLNHVELLKDKEKAGALMEEAKALFIRVKTESDEVALTRKALYTEAYCSLAGGDPKTVLELLEGAMEPAMPVEALLAPAYQMTGRVDEARTVLQAGTYQNIVVLFNFFPAYLMLCADNEPKFEETLRRACIVADAFDMKHLHPGVLVGLYLAAAQGYLVRSNRDRALDMLQQYTEIATSDIYPLKLHGDAYFDRIDGWIEKLDLGNGLPRDEKTIRRSMAAAVAQNPTFSVLAGEPRFQSICEKLQGNCR